MTKDGHIPWSLMNFNDPAVQKLFREALQESAQEQRGDYGPCNCERPGYQRTNPNICRHCNKPLRGRRGNE